MAQAAALSMSTRRAAARWLSGWMVAVVFAAGWLMFLRPTFLGGRTSYVIVAGVSMQPDLHTGDLVLAIQDERYERGDVIAYRVPAGEPGEGAMVIHRVIGGDGTKGYVTQGDNREGPDQWLPTDRDVLGRMRFMIPKAGALLPFLRSPLGVALFAGLLVFVMVAFERPQATSERNE